jgi:hypothetical protein
MKKINSLLITLIWVSNLHSQNWLQVINSTSSNFHYIYTGVTDTVSNTLYIGGFFDQINNLQTKAIVKYNGITFDTLGAGLNSQVSSLNPAVVKKTIMFQNKLYVAGQFEKAGKYFTNNLARWNGTDWDSVNFRMDGVISQMTVHNNELYVSGIFDSIGGIKSPYLAKYDGNSWYNVGQSYSEVKGVESFNGTLYRVNGDSIGVPCSDIEYYNGTTWTPWACVSGALKSILGIKKIDTLLFVYGRFDSINNTPCRGLASWNGTKWFNYSFGTNASQNNSSQVMDVSKINGELYACGFGDSIDYVSPQNIMPQTGIQIAKFDGNKWCTFLEPVNAPILFSLEYNNELYMGGFFSLIGNNTPVIPLLKWIGGDSTLVCGNFVGVKENYEFNRDLKIYPNPTTSILNIDNENNLLQNATIQIQNNLGQLVFTSPFTSQINLHSLSAGMYFLTVEDKDSKKTIKIIKQ